MARRRGRHAAPRPPRRGLTIALTIVAVLAVGGIVAGVTVPLATTGAGASSAGADALHSPSESNGRADAPAKVTPSATPGAVVDDPDIRYVESPLASDDPVITVAPPTRCPEGTLPSAVDASGNESGCEAIGG